ncbi:hypothetical protein QTH90_13660 [Variovorax sp. J2P1-59]|uniref:hypothetical protein n=1 Tax=Variovorax flavidus TaxID=3053501 RepID=UPI0025785702|nr:hypothetical protein [Variovorax sp. J2P1-59]MDM0075442.1 hypothetical protein [Variovorax sp. J2P1-59]
MEKPRRKLLGPLSPDSEFEYRGWLVRVETTLTDEVYAGHADLLCEGVHKCRVVLATSRLDLPSAQLALCSKARDFIDDWCQRDHSGTTSFQQL